MNLLGAGESIARHMHVIMRHRRAAIVEKHTHHERATADTRVRVSSRKDRKFVTRKTSSSGALARGAELVRDPRASDAVEDVDAAGCSCGASTSRKNQNALSGERNSGEKTARQ